ncbi:hypothetical protein [Streptomyces sp. NPDC085937]|uniref:hypothetical protein n=1 Tax=Streptomyces sp. NPDC085937 TaxID=3365742 RepID=UPI0037CF85DB
MTMLEQPVDLEAEPEAVRALVGRTITVTGALSGIPDSRPYLFRVTSARMSPDVASGVVWVTGDRLRMDGTPARRKRGPVTDIIIGLADGWPEVLKLPPLPPREWVREAVGQPVYADHQRPRMAARIVDQGATYRVTVGNVDEDQAVPGEQVARRVAEALGERGMRLDRHADGRALRMRYDDGRPPVLLTPES